MEIWSISHLKESISKHQLSYIVNARIEEGSGMKSVEHGGDLFQ
jgi:hypothetical protein